MTLKDLVMIAASINLHYLCKILRGEELRQFDTSCDQVGIKNITYLKHIILGLGRYVSPVNVLSKQNRAMRHGTSKPCELKEICYADLLIDIN